MTEAIRAEPLTPRSEEELIERHRYGDPEAFEEVYQRYERMIYNLALRLSGDPEEAEDLSQEIFIRIHRSLDRFQGRSSLQTWVFRIALNCCRSRLRKPSRRWWRQATGLEDVEKVADSKQSPERDVAANESSVRVTLALAKLPVTFREVVVLRDLQGLTYREIAQTTGCRLGTVRSRLARGRARLQELLKDGAE